ncbi:MAG: prolipoprotein diacylglyceryl transferase [Bacilli bacterium]|nr:prolipoprotein diacylglyceryl transferase [Bacilli bacterium]
MGLILFIIAAIIAIGSLGYLVYDLVNLIKTPMVGVVFQALLKKHGIIAGVFVAGLSLLFIAIPLWNKWNMSGSDWSWTIIFGILSSILGITSLYTFILHYYGKNIPEKLNKWLFTTLCVTFPLLFLSVILLSNGYANHWVYPLINGISFNGVAPRPGKGGAGITFYALCILSGAIYAYLISDHYMYKQYGKHGLLESTFLVAFPAGIIGARLFYVIGNWDLEFGWNSMAEVTIFGNTFKIWAPLAIMNGGLTILGGAITGIIVGVAWFMWRNKGYNIFIAVDIIIPTILVAQAAGRWGNFFNCEVYGALVSDAGWRWLPTAIFNNMHYDNFGNLAPAGMMHVPLFLIESVANLLGYFVLAHLFGIRFRKHTELGDICFGYLIWYGLTRALMEPLRDGAFNMGTNGYWSWIWSLVFILAGALLIVGNHIYHFIKKKKNGVKIANGSSFDKYLIQTGVVGGIGLVLLVTAIILMASSKFTATISYNSFNVGMILMFCAISVLAFLAITIPSLIEAKKDRQLAHE